MKLSTVLLISLLITASLAVHKKKKQDFQNDQLSYLAPPESDQAELRQYEPEIPIAHGDPEPRMSSPIVLAVPQDNDITGENGAGVYVPNEPVAEEVVEMPGANGGGIYVPSLPAPEQQVLEMPGENGHGIYVPNEPIAEEVVEMPGANGGGIYVPSLPAPEQEVLEVTGENGAGVYVPYEANAEEDVHMTGENGHGIYIPNEPIAEAEEVDNVSDFVDDEESDPVDDHVNSLPVPEQEILEMPGENGHGIYIPNEPIAEAEEVDDVSDFVDDEESDLDEYDDVEHYDENEYINDYDDVISPEDYDEESDQDEYDDVEHYDENEYINDYDDAISPEDYDEEDYIPNENDEEENSPGEYDDILHSPESIGDPAPEHPDEGPEPETETIVDFGNPQEYDQGEEDGELGHYYDEEDGEIDIEESDIAGQESYDWDEGDDVVYGSSEEDGELGHSYDHQAEEYETSEVDDNVDDEAVGLIPEPVPIKPETGGLDPVPVEVINEQPPIAGAWTEIDVNEVRADAHLNAIKRFAKSHYHGSKCGMGHDTIVWKLRKFEHQVVAGHNYRITYETRVLQNLHSSHGKHVFMLFEDFEGNLSISNCVPVAMALD